jgi:hypothetical protein
MPSFFITSQKAAFFLKSTFSCKFDATADNTAIFCYVIKNTVDILVVAKRPQLRMGATGFVWSIIFVWMTKICRVAKKAHLVGFASQAAVFKVAWAHRP